MSSEEYIDRDNGNEIRQSLTPAQTLTTCCTANVIAAIVICILGNSLYHIGHSERKIIVSLGGAFHICSSSKI